MKLHIYSFFNFDARLEWVAGSGRFTLGKEKRSEWVPGPVSTGAENLASSAILSPVRPTRSELLFQLRYTGPQFIPVTSR